VNTLNDLIGLKIVAVKGYPEGRSKYIEAEYIFFDDGETVLHLEEQDVSTYDCTPVGKSLRVYKDKNFYENILTSKRNPLPLGGGQAQEIVR
jgi:hypothetical protein